MSIRAKTLTIVGATVLVVVALFMIHARHTVMGGFTELEEGEMRLGVRRAVQAVHCLLSNLESTSGDWAARNDSYNFVQGLNRDFVANNLLDSTFTNLRLNFMVFLDDSRRPVYAKFFDLREGRQIPPPSGFMAPPTGVQVSVRRASSWTARQRSRRLPGRMGCCGFHSRLRDGDVPVRDTTMRRYSA